ncbi:Molybdopterin-guanine dinucleotide biosynthesis protein MobA [Citrifermentans bremense]|uniref:4-hydroxybenzoyl-CoA thioesterase n=2 Tax=Geobacteraceae TaxID=213422 RepID=A0ABQ0MEB5_9BACT|nr:MULTISPECIES: selenium cofactor biosynthesis protein YqeC [Geobacteraceae]BCG48244.1 Molybdopterin-guanine dinucleotide biosynthesis protein MobA [Citrifermentans bremense]GAW65368.1 4-hydroxybenzoyl-CoA thioesterase [Geoanaerobacter pelophilus]
MQGIEEVICSAPGGVLSLTGAGGKTSLMFHLARVLSQAGKRVLVTTTTKILPPTARQGGTVLVDADPEVIAGWASLRCGNEPVAAVSRRDPESGKLIGYPPEAIASFQRCGCFDWIVVEADGSARRPLKAHAPHEPVIPSCSTVVVAVAGLEVMGQPLTEEWVFRPELAAPLMGLAIGETVGAAALARLIAHPGGLFTGAPAGARRFLFLNKADTPQRLSRAAEIAAAVKEEAPFVAEALLVGQALNGVALHAHYPLGAP